MDRDKLLTTIDAVHRAGLEAAHWPDAMRSVARLFGAVGSSLEVFDKRTMVLVDFRTVGLPDGAETPYVEHYSRNNPRASYAMRNLSRRLLCDYYLIDERGMDRDAYYVEYLRSIGLRYFLTAQIVDTPDLHGIVSIQRSRRQGHVSESDVELMRHLMPHMHQAYAVTVRLRTAAHARDSLEGALDWLADGVALLRADGAVLYANRTMLEIARRRDGIRIARRRIEFTASDARARFAVAMEAIAQLASGDGTAAPPDFAVARPGGAPCYLVSVRPFDRAHGETGSERACAIVFVRDLLARDAVATQLLKESFGLTDAEAGLAHALHAGATVAEYARTRRLSLNTVYTHLRRIKEKTQTARQADLVRKLDDVRPPLRRPT